MVRLCLGHIDWGLGQREKWSKGPFTQREAHSRAGKLGIYPPSICHHRHLWFAHILRNPKWWLPMVLSGLFLSPELATGTHNWEQKLPGTLAVSLPPKLVESVVSYIRGGGGSQRRVSVCDGEGRREGVGLAPLPTSERQDSGLGV